MNQEIDVYEYCLDIWNYWEKKQLKRLEVIASGDQDWVRGRDWFSLYAFGSVIFFPPS